MSAVIYTTLSSTFLTLLYLILAALVKSWVIYIFGAIILLFATLTMMNAINLGMQDITRFLFNIPMNNDHWYKWLFVFLFCCLLEVLVLVGYYLQIRKQQNKKKNLQQISLSGYSSAPNI